MVETYYEHRQNVMTLNQLPIGTTIFFFKNGKERYLKKIRPNKHFPNPWYSAETGFTFRSERIPSDWKVLTIGRTAINNAQKNTRTGDKFYRKFRY